MNLKKQNAITLIALIITIIVLLILAGVTLSLIIGEDGIVGRAISAAEAYDIAGAKEQVELLLGQFQADFYEEKYLKGSTSLTNISDYIAEKLSGQNIGDYSVTASGKTIILSKSGQVVSKAKIKEDGSIGEWKDSEDVDGAWALDVDEDGKTIITNGDKILKIGDYVNYDPTAGATKTEYISPKEKTGWENDQKFKLSSYLYGWRVFGIDENNGQILLISEEIIGPDEGGGSVSAQGEYEARNGYYLKGLYEINNGVDELNKISSFYGQGKYATGGRCINAEDINNITEFDPSSYYDYGKEIDIDGTKYINNYYEYYFDDSGYYDVDDEWNEYFSGDAIIELIFGSRAGGTYYFTQNSGPIVYWLAESVCQVSDWLYER